MTSHLKKKIMVVDDDPDIVDLLVSFLQSENFEVFAASNGEAALKKVSAFQPDLIILDMNMPKMGGLAFYHEIYDSTKDRPRYPVLFLTGRSEMEGVLMDLHADGFLAKPFQIRILLSKIQSILASRGGAEMPLRAETPKGKKHAFVIEYDTNALGAITVEFLKAGYLVSAAETVAVALEKLKTEKPGIILIRMEMPDMPGDMFAYKIRQMPGMASVPIVLYTPSCQPFETHLTTELCKQIRLSVPLNAADPMLLLARAEQAVSAQKAA